MADEEFQGLGIGRVLGSSHIHQGGIEKPGENRERQSQNRPKRSRKELRRYLHTVRVAVDESNRILEQKGLPYRISIREENDRVLLCVFRASPDGSSVSEIVKDVTDEDFSRWIEDISRIEGLYFDRTV